MRRRTSSIIAIAIGFLGAAAPAASQGVTTYGIAHRIAKWGPDGLPQGVNSLDVVEIPSGRLANRVDLPSAFGYLMPFKSPDERFIYLLGQTQILRYDVMRMAVSTFSIEGATALTRGFASSDGRTLYLIDAHQVLHVDANSFTVTRRVPLAVDPIPLYYPEIWRSVQVSPDGTALYVVSPYGRQGITFYSIDINSGAILRQSPPTDLLSTYWFQDFEVIPDGTAAFVTTLVGQTKWLDLATFQWVSDRPELPSASDTVFLDGTRAFFAYDSGRSTDSCGVFDWSTGVKVRPLPCNATNGPSSGARTSDKQFLFVVNTARPSTYAPLMFIDTNTWNWVGGAGSWIDSSYYGWAATATVRPDTVAPVFQSTPAVIPAEATDGTGATVLFETPAAIDAIDGPVTVECTPTSGSRFALGLTTVVCSAQDMAGNVAETRFQVDVRDSTPPTLTGVPADATAEASSSSGAIVSFSQPVALDAVSGATAVSCVPTTGALFPLGATRVTCQTADQAGNTARADFVVTVRDTTPPIITLPDPMTVSATSASGVVVTFSVKAADVVSGPVVATCLPASGSIFPVGATAVTCTARDDASNLASGSFTITVKAATPGEMNGEGAVHDTTAKYHFEFNVVETARISERARLHLEVDPTAKNARHAEFVSTSVTSVAFSDDPAIRPGRSSAPQVDTVEFTGSGRWNGATGYRYRVVATDQGEPGRHRETFAVTIWAPDGHVVASISGQLDSGNVQSVRIRH